MNGVRYFYLCLAQAVMLASCSVSDDVSDTDTKDSYLLVLCVNATNQTMRQGSDVVQAEGQPFRGLQDVVAIPFYSNADISVDDAPLVKDVSSGSLTRVENRYYYYLEDCPIPWGTNRLLVYGRAIPKETSVVNGKVVTTLGTSPLPADITFSLSPFRDTYDVHDDARDLADYLTAIANTDGWSETSESALKALYLNFIKANSEDSGPYLGGSARVVKAYVKALREQLQTFSGDLPADIIANIDSTAEFNDCLDNGYPSSLGLPDGAAVIRWTGTAFEVRTATTTLDNVNGIIRYTYPAELWYLTNSPIETSDADVAHSKYENADGWTSLLEGSFHDGGQVGLHTKAIGVKEPLQYGVCRLQTVLETITGTIRDAKNMVVEYGGSASNLPMTGVIIGGQHTVGFDFKPIEPQSDVDARFIYDPVEGNPASVNTLVLQSYDNEKVPVILEFENKTGRQFYGRDGIIYPDTKFYLIAQLDPAGKGTGAYANRVFTQDYTTTVNMKVTSLANAYSCMPDLLEPRLELGVQVAIQWIQSTPTTVKL
ncbi:MAG: hypothetical protein IJV17_00310 [Prevotella sp.]|nr:hypothetical protein [Prevotella sp.]